MTIPKAFFKLSGLFYQGSHDEYPDEAAWIAGTARHLSVGERKRAKAFLARILFADVSDEELTRIRLTTSPQYTTLDGSVLRAFLRKVHEAL